MTPQRIRELVHEATASVRRRESEGKARRTPLTEPRLLHLDLLGEALAELRAGEQCVRWTPCREMQPDCGLAPLDERGEPDAPPPPPP